MKGDTGSLDYSSYRGTKAATVWGSSRSFGKAGLGFRIDARTKAVRIWACYPKQPPC